MPITIGSNIAALRAERRLNEGSETLSRVYERLSSGQRINRASDDAAGLAIASSLQTDSRVFTQALRNVNDGLSLLAISQGALHSLSDIVTRITELSEQASNGIYGLSQRAAIDNEAQALALEFARVASTTTFNGLAPFYPAAPQIELQVGLDSSANSRIAITPAQSLVQSVADGTFQNGVLTTGLGRGNDIDLADLNGDGKADILATGDSGSSLYMRLGNGDGSFKAVTTLPPLGSSGGRSEIPVDFNGDEALDLIFQNGGDIKADLNNGGGTFTNVFDYNSGFAFSNLTIGDVNGDGKVDAVFAEYTNDMAQVLIGNGNGTFSGGVSYAIGNNQARIELSDLNKDGVLDLISAPSIGGIRVRLGQGDGTFGSSTTAGATGVSTVATISTDIDGDGNVDIGVSSSTASGILFGNGNGTFRSFVTVSTNLSIDAIRDLNEDQKLDIVNISSGTLRVLLGNGNGSFASFVTYASGASVNRGIAFGDINSDGITDIASTTYTEGGIALWLGNATQSIRLPRFSLRTSSGALSALDQMRPALQNIESALGTIGALQSRLDSAARTISVTRENYVGAEGRIRDTDIASDSAELARVSILQQSASAVLAQANQQPTIALQLLRAN